MFLLFEFIGGWDEFGTTSEGMDGGVFVSKWLVAVEWDVLVGVSGFAIDVEVQGAIAVSDDGDVEHGDASFTFSHVV